MIDASFGRTGRNATVSGAYQYDTGQRLRMYGLPSPDELAEMDELLSGDMVSVQAQYSYVGDGQTEMRLAMWDDGEGAWIAEVPDVYLTRNDDVRVYIYVNYGSTEKGMRTKTCYEVVFRPQSRPAPSDKVTPDQTNQWDALVKEVNAAIGDAGSAASAARAAETVALETAEKLNGLSAEAVTLEAGSEATAEVIGKSGRKHIVIGVPKGEKGDQGVPGVFSINGQEVTNNAAVVLDYEDVGAMPKDYTPLRKFSAQLPLANVYGDPPLSVNIDVAGILETDMPIVDLDMSEVTADTADEVLESWAAVSRIEALDGKLKVTCLTDKPTVPFKIKIMCVR